MVNVLDIVYGAGVVGAAPYWLIKGSARKKVLGALRKRMGTPGGTVGKRDTTRPGVMIHAVSVGEINATRSLVAELRQKIPAAQFIVSVTTETGWARAAELYGNDPDVILVRYPLDFSTAVSRVLDGMKPSIVVLMELELWPNFLRGCRNRAIPVILVNGRLTAYSFNRYRLVKPVASAMLRGLASVCVQDETYATRFIELGAPPDKVRVTGTMKFDTAQVGSSVAGDAELARDVGIAPAEKVWVCGSTGPGEEQITLNVYRRLQPRFPTLRLAIIPRKPERFDEVAQLITRQGFGVLRRSQPQSPPSANPSPVILGDTMGELRKFYSLASVVFVGRSLVDLGSRQHGSDMIEPAGLAKACIVGPFTGNFAEVMMKMRAAKGMLEVSTEDELERTIAELLADQAGTTALGARAQAVVVSEKGATARHVEEILAAMQPIKKL